MVAATGGLLAGPVMAAAPADGGPAAMHEGHRGGGFHKGMRDGLWIPGLGPVSKAQLDQLKLDDKQQALVKTAQDGQRSLHEAMRASGGQRHDLLKAQLDSGKLDPRALLEQSDKSRDQFGTQAKQVRDQWLAVWDSLNDAQRAQVTQMLKERQAKMQERHARMEGRHGKGPGNAPGAVPPPPPAPAAN
ncbi:ATPase [Achromobacter ruhlandii]|nr:ATPase [Achromobacter ruhlandii]